MNQNYEDFSDNQIEILNSYVTNGEGSIFALRRLPEVFKSALFVRYASSGLRFRSLLLKEISLHQELAGGALKSSLSEEGEIEERRTLFFNKSSITDSTLDGSKEYRIEEFGGAHLVIEQLSLIAVSKIRNLHLMAALLEKSNKYIYFDQKFRSEYLFYREPILMASAYRDLYLVTCQLLFDAYARLIPRLKELIEKKYPRDPTASDLTYTTSLRMRVIDNLRGLLPASALTYLAIYGPISSFNRLASNLNKSNLLELQDIALRSYGELKKVFPFLEREVEDGNQKSLYKEKVTQLKTLIDENPSRVDQISTSGMVRLIDYDIAALCKMVASFLFEEQQLGLFALEERCRQLPKHEIELLFDLVAKSSVGRESLLAHLLERSLFTFEYLSDFALYQDIQRQAKVEQQMQLFTCYLGYDVPEEILGTPLEYEYRSVMDEAKRAYERVSKEFIEEAQYLVPIGYKCRWYLRLNLHQLRKMLDASLEQNSICRGMIGESIRQVCDLFPLLKIFFSRLWE